MTLELLLENRSVSSGLENLSNAAGARLTSGQRQLGEARPWRINLIAGARLTDHVTGHQVAVEDVPGGGHEAAAVTHPVQGVCVDLEVALTVGFGGEGRQTDQTDERTLTWGPIKKKPIRLEATDAGVWCCRWVLPLWVRMWISSELALGQLLLHCGKGQMRSLG